MSLKNKTKKKASRQFSAREEEQQETVEKFR